MARIKIFGKTKKDRHENKCAFCGEKFSELSIEHLIMFNGTECGLSHPGNIVPLNLRKSK